MFRVKKSVTPAEHKHSLGGFEHDTPYFMQHQIVCVVNPLVDGDRTAGGPTATRLATEEKYYTTQPGQTHTWQSVGPVNCFLVLYLAAGVTAYFTNKAFIIQNPTLCGLGAHGRCWTLLTVAKTQNIALNCTMSFGVSRAVADLSRSLEQVFLSILSSCRNMAVQCWRGPAYFKVEKGWFLVSYSISASISPWLPHTGPLSAF